MELFHLVKVETNGTETIMLHNVDRGTAEKLAAYMQSRGQSYEARPTRMRDEKRA